MEPAHLSQGRCQRIVEHLAHEVVLLGGDGSVLFGNEAARNAFGKDLDGGNFAELVIDTPNKPKRKLALAMRSNQWMPINLTIAKGAMKGVELHMRGRGFRGDDGKPELLLIGDRRRDEGFQQLRALIRNLNQELAKRQEANSVLERALDAESRLHRELIHRVKNNLALLNALISFRRRATNNDEVQEALNDLEMRVHAIRAVHDLLDQAGEIDRVQAGELIRALCHQLRQSVLPEHIDLRNELLDVSLSVDAATPLSLLVNELITNAAKHAFPDGQNGTVTVELKKNGVDKLEVSIADDGRGMAEGDREGSGSRIVTALAAQINGSLERKSSPGGTTWTFIFPHDWEEETSEAEGDQSEHASP